ncbi:MAG: FeoB-associated Cys-rich membrane protein [Planctomycetota bacterium]
MWWQWIIVGLIVAAAVGGLGWSLYRTLRGRGCTCGRGGECPLRDACDESR